MSLPARPAMPNLEDVRRAMETIQLVQPTSVVEAGPASAAETKSSAVDNRSNTASPVANVMEAKSLSGVFASDESLALRTTVLALVSWITNVLQLSLVQEAFTLWHFS